MKCYAIQSGGEFIADVPRPISDSYWNSDIQTVECDDEAKHYKTKGIPTKWLTKYIGKWDADIKRLQQEIVNAKGTKNQSYYTNSYQTRLDGLEKNTNWVKDAKVVELDMEKPNFPSPIKVMWERWRGDNHKSNMYLSTNTTSRYTCKACGLKLKNVPYYDIPEGNGSRVCIPCLYIRLDAIKTAYEGMDEDFRTTITNELILGGL